MKKFWLILLPFGLMMVFSASAFAVDVKVTGEYYVTGLYVNKVSVADVDTNPSSAFFYQRLRVGTDIIVSPGLKLVTRFDALERVWGGQRSNPGTGGALSDISAKDSSGTTAENENIAVDWAYVDYVSPIGTFDVGIMNDSATGTVFGDSTAPAGRIVYSNTFGPVTLTTLYAKLIDKSASYATTATTTDADKEKYYLEGRYQWNSGKAALAVTYVRDASKKPPTNNYLKNYFQFTPWTIAKIGPVNLQAEVNWATGKIKYDNGVLNADGLSEVTIYNLSGWIDATATFAPLYFGGTLAYVSGDDPNTTDKQEGGTLTGGQDWNPAFILFSYYDVAKWAGNLSGYDSSLVVGPMTNAWFFQGRVGVKPVADLDIVASVSYATADKKPKDFIGGTYGTEVDLVGTYKITNNLSYILGAGYLFTGDYFKGKNGDNKVVDDYALVNKLILSF